MPEGVGGFLVGSVEECARRLVELLRDPARAAALARRGQEHVRQHFLLPRLLADELRLFEAVLGTTPLTVRRWEQEASLGSHDLVCGMPIEKLAERPAAEFGGQTYRFCSETCRTRFLQAPARYLPPSMPPADPDAAS
jgi:trehalose synthase